MQLWSDLVIRPRVDERRWCPLGQLAGEGLAKVVCFPAVCGVVAADFFGRWLPRGYGEGVVFLAVQDEFPAKMVCCSLLAIWVHTNVVYVRGSGLDLTEFVCLSVVARGDVAKDFASGNAGRSV